MRQKYFLRGKNYFPDNRLISSLSSVGYNKRNCANEVKENETIFESLAAGVVFVLAATGGLLLLANNPHGGEHLRELLTGQILWVNWLDLIPLAVLAAAYWLLVWLKPAWLARLLARQAFYLLFALVITFSVQVVGVYLVFASLVIPAFAVWREQSASLHHAFVLGLLGYGVGLAVSTWLDLPTGASIVWFLALAGVGYRLTPSPSTHPATSADKQLLPESN